MLMPLFMEFLQGDLGCCSLDGQAVLFPPAPVGEEADESDSSDDGYADDVNDHGCLL